MKINKTLKLDGRLADKQTGDLAIAANVIFDPNEGRYRAERSFGIVTENSNTTPWGTFRGSIKTPDGNFIISSFYGITGEAAYPACTELSFVQEPINGNITANHYTILSTAYFTDIIANANSELLEGTYIPQDDGSIILVIVGNFITPRFIKLIKTIANDGTYVYSMDPIYHCTVSWWNKTNREFASSDDAELTKIYPNFANHNLTVSEYAGTGSCLVGNYNFYISYEIIKGIYTDWSAPSNQFTVVNPVATRADDIGNGKILKGYVDGGTRTSYTFSLQYSYLPANFTSARIAVTIDTPDGKKAFIFKNLKIDTTSMLPAINHLLTFTYSGQVGEEVDISEVITPKVIFNNIRTITNTGTDLIIGNVNTKGFFNFQPYANGITTKLLYNQTSLYPDSTGREGTTDGNALNIELSGLKGMMPGEVYALYIHLKYKDGTVGPGFHIPGRAAVTHSFLKDSLGNAISERDTCSNLEVSSRTVMERTHYGTNKVYQVCNNIDSSTLLSYWENEEELYPANFIIKDYNGNQTGTLTGNVRHHALPSAGASVANKFYGISLQINNVPVLNSSILDSDGKSVAGQIAGYVISYAKRNVDSSIVQAIVTGVRQEAVAKSPSGTQELYPIVSDLQFEVYNPELEINKVGIYANVLRQETYRKTSATFTDDFKSSALGGTYRNAFIRDMTVYNHYEVSGFMENITVNRAKINSWAYVPENNSIASNSYRTNHLLLNLDSANNGSLLSNLDGTYYSLVSIKRNVYLSKENQVLVYAGYLNLDPTNVTPRNESFGANNAFVLSFDSYSCLARMRVNCSGVIQSSQFDNWKNGSSLTFNAQGYIVNVFGNASSPPFDFTPYGGTYGQTNGSFRSIGADSIIISSTTTVSLGRKTNMYLKFIYYGNLNLFGTYQTLEDFDNEYLSYEYPRYNDNYSKVNDYTLGLPYNYLTTYPNQFPFDLYRSRKYNTGTESNAFIFLANAVYTTSKTKGNLFKLTATGKKLFIQYENSLFIAEVKESLAMLNTTIALSQGDLFTTMPNEVYPQEGGFIGSKSRYAIFMLKGLYFVADSDRGRVYLVADSNNVTELTDIYTRNYIRNNFLNSIVYTPYATSGAKAGNTLIAGYDDINDRILLAKSPYQTYPIIAYANRGGLPSQAVDSIGISYSLLLKGFTSIHNYSGINAFLYKRKGIANYGFGLTQNGTFPIVTNIDDGVANTTPGINDGRIGYYGYLGTTFNCPIYIDIIFNFKSNFILEAIKYMCQIKHKDGRNYYDRSISNVLAYTDIQCSDYIVIPKSSNSGWYSSRENSRTIYKETLVNNIRNNLTVTDPYTFFNVFGVLDSTKFSTLKNWYNKDTINNKFVVIRLYNSTASTGYNLYDVYFDEVDINIKPIAR